MEKWKIINDSCCQHYKCDPMWRHQYFVRWRRLLSYLYREIARCVREARRFVY